MLDNFFNAKHIAIVGVSREPSKVGHVIFRNFIDNSFEKNGGRLFAVNPNAFEILGHRVYKSVEEIPEKVDLVIIAVPSASVLSIVKQCARQKIKDIVVISSGFSEVGNVKEEEKLGAFIKANKIRMIGVNCLGIYDAYSKIDTLFNPRSRMTRPREGGISFVCQSGAVGASILDIMSEQGYGISKFVSYGNATTLDESDILTYLAHDEKTKVIALYLEGVKEGRKFLGALKVVCKKKPVIVLKAGITEQGSKAVMSHTGSLAGSAEVY
ncbi:MAG: CoA-binding protein, partial [Nanoarchaeota archaeon]